MNIILSVNNRMILAGFLLFIIAIVIFFISEKNSTLYNANQSVSNAKIYQEGSVNQNYMSDQYANNQNIFHSPLSQAAERVTKKPFGIYVTPKNSPVQPERFQGYHAGTDFEIFPKEKDAIVPVQVVCDGKLIMKRNASGYGGIAIESCELDKEPITVIYGHLNLSSIGAKTGDDLKAGDILGNLGAAYSVQTDGERKHLHLGFHKGSMINILGYVSSQSQLSDLLNPCDYVCTN